MIHGSVVLKRLQERPPKFKQVKNQHVDPAKVIGTYLALFMARAAQKRQRKAARAWPTQGELALITQTTPRTIWRALQVLKAARMIDFKQSGLGTVNEYMLLSPEQWK